MRAHLASLIALATLGGCAGPHPTDRPDPVAQVGGPLTPGDPRLDLPSVTAPVRRTSALYVERGGERQPFGTLAEEVRRTADGGLVRVQRVVSPRGDQLDSLAAAADLAPRSHYSRNPGRTVELRFGRGAVTGTYAAAGGATVAVDDALPGAAFDSNFIDLVARAVPLTAGFEADVRTYERASAGAAATAVTYTVRVVGPEPVGDREAVVVEFTKGEGLTRLFVDPDTRALLRTESEVAPGVTLVIEPT